MHNIASHLFGENKQHIKIISIYFYLKNGYNENLRKEFLTENKEVLTRWGGEKGWGVGANCITGQNHILTEIVNEILFLYRLCKFIISSITALFVFYLVWRILFSNSALVYVKDVSIAQNNKNSFVERKVFIY